MTPTLPDLRSFVALSPDWREFFEERAAGRRREEP
jgi:hypothetical protein